MIWPALNMDDFLSELAKTPALGVAYSLEPVRGVQAIRNAKTGVCVARLRIRPVWSSVDWPTVMNLLAAVLHQELTGFVDLAARRLGLSRNDYREIYAANHEFMGFDRPLRARLIAACGLVDVHPSQREPL